MHTTPLRALVLSAALLPAAASAQGIGQEQIRGLWLPTVSPGARVGQTVGLTQIEIVYHRPAVDGRALWGELVPWGQVWRTGANENTTITFSTDVTIEDQQLEAGTYGLHTVPGEEAWTVIFSRDHRAWGSYAYDEANDALRVTTQPTEAAHQERLQFSFGELTERSATVHLRWGTLDVPFTVGVDTEATVLASIRDQLKGLGAFSWIAPHEAAQWCLDHDTHLEEALAWADQSIQAEPRFANQSVRASLLRKLDRNAEADAAMAAALQVAGPGELHNYGRSLQAEGKLDEAMAIFKRNARANPDTWYVDVGLARGHSGLGRLDKAAKHMRAALQRAPEAQKAYLQGFVEKLEQGEAI